MIFNMSGGSGGSSGTLTVTAPAGVTASVSKDNKTKTKIVGVDGLAVFKGLDAGEWTVTITDGEDTATKKAIVNTDYSITISFNVIPEFTYTGDYQIVNDADEEITESQDNWKVRFLTSGTLTFTTLNDPDDSIDVFCVGGGGGGRTCSSNHAPGGGGGGYTTTKKDIIPEVGKDYEITVGAGGSADAGGGTSTAFGVSADGGSTAPAMSSGYRPGGAGGSGGGAGKAGANPGAGGEDGSDGGSVDGGTGGKGQGTTTREFGEETGTLYAGGGSGGTGGAGTQQPGGAGGGGTGGRDASIIATDGTTNTGGGGGGAGMANTPAGAGGSGIVIIRNHRA